MKILTVRLSNGSSDEKSLSQEKRDLAGLHVESESGLMF